MAKTIPQEKSRRNSAIVLGFKKAGIPLEFRNDNTFPGISGEQAALTFRVGVETRTGQERIRLAPGDDSNNIRVLDIDPKKQQLVLMVKEPAREFKIRNRFVSSHAPESEQFQTVKTPSVARRVLMGMDETHLFVTQLPSNGPITTIKQAHDALRPRLVHETKGWKRQGEWFFVPVTASEARILASGENCRLSHDRDVEDATSRGTGRVARARFRTHQAKDRMDYFGDPAIRPSVFPAASPDRAIRPTKIFVRGDIKHPDHKNLKLRDWHRVMLNLEVFERSNNGWTNFVD